jgi:hypothetical protein
MKKYKSSDLTHKRAEVLKEAKTNGVIIQERNTNGDVRCEYVIITRELMHETVDNCSLADGCHGDTKQMNMWHATQPNLKY